MASRILFWSGVLAASATAQQQQRLCASVNTASTAPKPNVFQSVGACTATCGGQYAYAVLQNNLCWCSNYTPDTSTQSSGCNLPCPGYPSDVCGSAVYAGLFSYVVLDAGLIQGTKGSGGGKQSSSEKTSSPPSSPSSTAKPSTAQQEPPETTIIGDQVQTVTVRPTDVINSSAPQSSSTTPPDDNSLGTPAVVGIVIGSIIAAVALAAAAAAILILHKKRNAVGVSDDGASARGSDWEGLTAAKDPFPGMYGRRDRSGSIETVLPPSEQCLRITNPDPPEK